MNRLRPLLMFGAALLLMACASQDDRATPTHQPTLLPAFRAATQTAIALPEPTDTPEPVNPAIVQWLQRHVNAFDSTTPGSASADLQAFKGMIGGARIVALGEATHGTHEFFEMKARLFQYLAQELGFDTFGIEASAPEAARINDYIQTGRGDPQQLLAGLGVWQLQAQEVLDLIQWMRDYNASDSHPRKLYFFGFDMQFPRGAMDDVAAYLEKVDAAAAAEIAPNYQCLRPFQDDEPGYAAQDPAVREACAANLQNAYAEIDARRAQCVAATSYAEFTAALHDARMVMQAEEIFRTNNRFGARDKYMAENVAWTLEQRGLSSRVVLWAHNRHIATRKNSALATMDWLLRQQYGAQLVTVAFTFYLGSFNARTLITPIYTPGAVQAHQAPPSPEDSFEYRFSSAMIPRFYLWLHNLPALQRYPNHAPATDWIQTTSRLRSIGAAFDDHYPNNYFMLSVLPEDFDVVFFFRDTTPSRLLPQAFRTH